MRFGHRRQGSVLFEQMMSIGIIGIILLISAASMIQTNRAQLQSQLSFEANSICKNLLEQNLAKSITLHTVSAAPVQSITGKFLQGATYQADVNIFSLGTAAPALATGLNDSDIKGIRTTVRWKDTIGDHTCSAEGFCINMTR